MDEIYSLTAARSHLGELNVNDLADLEDRAALAAHLAARLAGRGGVPLEDLDAALDRIDAEDRRRA